MPSTIDLELLKNLMQQRGDCLVGALRDANAIDDKPLVLAGVAYETEMFSNLAGKDFNIIGRVDGNVDEQSDTELHAAAWPVLEEYLQRQRSAALPQLQEADPAKIVNTVESVANAALQGNVHSILYATK